MELQHYLRFLDKWTVFREWRAFKYQGTSVFEFMLLTQSVRMLSGQQSTTWFSGMFIETVYCGLSGMSSITYAHNKLDRLLMTEMHVWDPNGGQV